MCATLIASHFQN